VWLDVYSNSEETHYEVPTRPLDIGYLFPDILLFDSIEFLFLSTSRASDII